MTPPDAQHITNRAVLSGRKVASRMRIFLVPVMLAFILDVVPCSEAGQTGQEPDPAGS